MLIPDISWRERYVSHALNRKFFGVIPVGVYRGFGVTKNNDGTVTIDTSESVAVVETNGYNITVTGDGSPETIAIPDGEYKLVIRAKYSIGSTTTAEILAVDTPQKGDAVIAETKRDVASNVITIIEKKPSVILTNDNNQSGMDFGELSIDLGDIGVDFVGEKVDFGEL